MSTLLKVCKEVVKNSIDLEGYLEGSTIGSVYWSEYGHNGISAKACTDYLQGLPSACTIPFANFDILELLAKAGITRKSDSGQIKLVDDYWQACGQALYQIIGDNPSICVEGKGITASINTFNHGRDLYGNGIAHYQAWVDSTRKIIPIASCSTGSKRQQVGYSGQNEAALYSINKLGYNLDMSKASSYDYQGIAHYPVRFMPLSDYKQLTKTC